MVLAVLEGGAHLVLRLQEEFDHEMYLEATKRAQIRVAPDTWKAFELTAIEGLTGKQASEQISMQIAQVYVAKRRVQQIIKEEITKLKR